MSSNMEFTVELIMFAPVLIGIAIIIAIIIANINYKIESKYLNGLLDRCIKNKGFDFVKNILEISKNNRWSKSHTIDFLEKSCNVKHQKTTKEKLKEFIVKPNS